MKTTFISLLLLFLPLNASYAQEQTTPKPTPQLISKIAYACAPSGTSTALKFESGTVKFTVRALIWGAGLTQLRREGKLPLERNLANAADRTLGFLELCEVGKQCRPLVGRIELTSTNLVVGAALTGRLYWQEAQLNKEVSLPLTATIEARTEVCN